jgi:hypothetical protein
MAVSAAIPRKLQPRLERRVIGFQAARVRRRFLDAALLPRGEPPFELLARRSHSADLFRIGRAARPQGPGVQQVLPSGAPPAA